MFSKYLAIIALCLAAVVMIITAVDHFFIDAPVASEAMPSPSPGAETEATADDTIAMETALPEPATASATTAAEPQPVVLVITETDINAEAAAWLPEGQVSEEVPLEITGIAIDLQPGNIISADVDVIFLGFQSSIGIESRVGIVEGQPFLEVTDVTAPLPALEDTIASLVEQEMAGLLDQIADPALVGLEGHIVEYREITTSQEDITIEGLMAQ